MHDVEQIEQELREHLDGMSHEAREIVDESLRTPPPEGRDAEKFAAVIRGLSPADNEDLGRAFALMHQLEQALLGGKHLAKQLVSVCQRAQELEPSLAEKGCTVGEAVTVLERHGIRHGLSEEVMTMTVEVPRS